MDLLLIVKIVSSVGLVWLSIFLGEKINLKYTGLITSFPTIVALVILFIGIEQGSQEAGIAAFKISHAIVLFNFWMLFYLLLIRLHPFLVGSLSVLLFFGAAFGFHAIFTTVPAVPYAYLLYAVTLGFGFIIFKNTPDVKMNLASKDTAVLTTIKYLFTPMLVVTFTWLSRATSPVWAGIFISAPSTGLVTLVYFHYKFGVDTARKTLESFYLYTGTFVVFGLAIYFSLPRYSFVNSFILGIITASAYAYIVNLNIIPRLKAVFK